MVAGALAMGSLVIARAISSADEPSPKVAVGSRPSPATAPAGSAIPDVRPLIREATAVASRTVTREGLDRYLDSLEAQARRNGKVTALEVEPGLEMIERLSDDEGASGRWIQRVNSLSRELRREPAEPSLEAARQRVDGLAGALERELDEEKRQAIVRDYLQVAGSLSGRAARA